LFVPARFIFSRGSQTNQGKTFLKITAAKKSAGGRGVPLPLLQKLYSPSWLYRGGTLRTECENVGLRQKSAAASSTLPEVLRAVGSQNGYNNVVGKTILICTISFVVGAMMTAAPFLIVGHFAHLDEVARGEPTMGPGTTTFLGLLASPVGGTVALLIGLWVSRRSKRKAESKSCNH